MKTFLKSSREFAIGIFVKHAAEKQERTSVHHAELWGKRDDKYSWLEINTIDTTDWTELNPKSPNYLLVRYSESVIEEYERYWKITDIFPVKQWWHYYEARQNGNRF